MVQKKFDETYPTRDELERFDARDTAFGQALKKTGQMLSFVSPQDRANTIKKKRPGFSLKDYALHNAAGMYETPMGERHTQDTGFYKWSGLGAAKEYPGIDRWEGSPAEAANIVSKAAMFPRSHSS